MAIGADELIIPSRMINDGGLEKVGKQSEGVGVVIVGVVVVVDNGTDDGEEADEEEDEADGVDDDDGD